MKGTGDPENTGRENPRLKKIMEKAPREEEKRKTGEE